MSRFVIFLATMALLVGENGSRQEEGALNAGTIHSDNYPKNYSNGLHDIYRVVFHDLVLVSLQFESFLLEESVNCKADYVEIFAGNELAVPKLCGKPEEQLQINLTHPVYEMTLIFHTDESVSMAGFSMDYLAVLPDPKMVCKSMHRKYGLTQEISSLLVGNQGHPWKYPRDIHCQWSVYIDISYELSLEVNLLRDVFGDPCRHNSVEIRVPHSDSESKTVWELTLRTNKTDIWSPKRLVGDSESASGILLGRYCGNMTNPVILMTNSSMVNITFHSVYAIENGYFRVVFRPIEMSRQTHTTWMRQMNVSSSTGKQASLDMTVPNPAPYPDINIDTITWVLQTAPGFIIQYEVFSMDNKHVYPFDSPTSDPTRQLRIRTILADREVGYSSGFYLTLLCRGFAEKCPTVMYRSLNAFNATSHGLQVNHIKLQWGRPALFEYYNVFWQCCSYAQFTVPSGAVRISFIADVSIWTNVDSCRHFGIFIYDGDLLEENRYGPFCEIFKGSVKLHLDNFVSQHHTLYVVIYMFGDPWPYVFTTEPVLSLVMSMSSCLRIYDAEGIGKFVGLNLAESGKCFALYYQADTAREYTLSIQRTLQMVAGDLQGNLLPFCQNKSDLEDMIPDMYIHNPGKFINGSMELHAKSIYFRSETNMSRCNVSKFVNILMGTDDKSCNHLNCGQRNIGAYKCLILAANGDRLHNCQWYLQTHPNAYWKLQILKFTVNKGLNRTGLDYLTIKDHSDLITKFTNVRHPREYHTISHSIHLNVTSTSGLNVLIFAIADADFPTLHDESIDNNDSVSCVEFEGACYEFIRNTSITWKEANDSCTSRQMSLLTLRSVDELNFIKKTLASVWQGALLRGSFTDVLFIGLTGTNSDKEGYRWTDGSPLTITDWYYPFDDLNNRLPAETGLEFTSEAIQPTAEKDQTCVAMVITNPRYSLNWHKIPCFKNYSKPIYICKGDLHSNTNREDGAVDQQRHTHSASCLSYQFPCNDGTCLNPDSKCNGQDDCLQGEDEEDCVYGDNLFTCDTGHTIHVSSCCDGRNDCTDHSDETNCDLEDCFRCSTGLCLPDGKTCDGLDDCPDGSDEESCPDGKQCAGYRCPSGECIPAEKTFDMVADCVDNAQSDERYDFTLHKTDLHWVVKNGKPRVNMIGAQSCPGGSNESRCNAQHVRCYPNDIRCVYDKDVQGHLKYCRNGEHLRECRDHNCSNMFKCPGAYCIPHRRVCDDSVDCPDRSDEINCENYTCPGLFRCKGSRGICLTQDELCDGFVHCQNSSDDEHFCEFKLGEMPCPHECHCEGYHVDCSENSLSSMPHNLPTNARTLIIHSNILSSVSTSLEFRSLVVLDLSYNVITTVNESAFVVTSNLLHLRLHHNALDIFENSTFTGLKRLRSLEIQGNPISHLHLGLFSSLVNLIKLNMSNLLVNHLPVGLFEGLVNLQVLDLAANRIKAIEPGTLSIFQNLKLLNITNNTLEDLDRRSLEELKVVNFLTDSYRFCCYVRDNIVETCSPQSDITSSCGDLLASRYHKAFVWIIGLSALVGNLVVLVWRVSNGLRKVPSILIFNLCLSDMLMGVFLLIVASSDVFYRGNYALEDPVWRGSIACHVAGVLALVSSETSMITIVFIAVDRALKIILPFGPIKNTIRRTVVAIVVCWLITISLSVIPIFLSVSLGSFYGRTAICAPFIFTDLSDPAVHYGMAIFVIPNSLALVLVIGCYLAIYISVKKSGNVVGRQDKYEVELAKKFGLIILTDFLAWFPVLFTVVAYQFNILLSPGETSIMALVIFPLNSAINPYLYSFTRSKRTMEQRSS